MHIVRSELVEELLALRDGGAAEDAAPPLVVINVLPYDTSEASAPREDADGDLELPRRQRPRRRRRGSSQDETTTMPVDDASSASIELETMAACSADATGTQLWRASFLLAEYLQFSADEVRDAVVVELGCGVGFVAIAAARLARRVYATDGDRSALAVCTRNVERNPWARDRVGVQYLQWGRGMHDDDDSSADKETSASAIKERTLLSRRIDWIVASDVFYDDEVADLFLDTLHELMQQYPTAKVVVAAERRIVFSAVTLSEVSLGYDAFQRRLCHHLHRATTEAVDPHTSIRTCHACCTDGSSGDTAKPRFVATRIPPSTIPRVYTYERVSTLAIWQLHAIVTTSS